MMFINSAANAYPYLMLLSICLIVLALVFWRYPSFRRYRRRRNLAIYFGLALVFSLIAYQAYKVSLDPTFISFEIEKTQTPIYSGQQNHFSLTCYSNGVKEASFYMTFKSANATLQANGEQDYVQVNSTTLKIPFAFHGNGEQTKLVYFTADSNVTSFAFYPRIQHEDDFIVISYLSEIQCKLDPATHGFTMADSPVQAVP
jgi:hypothetical protein